MSSCSAPIVTDSSAYGIAEDNLNPSS